jgi:hypothetical protein
MNLSEFAQISLLLAGLISIPFLSSSINISDDYKFGLAVALNQTPTKIGEENYYSLKKEFDGEVIRYSYSTPFGKYIIETSPYSLRMKILRIGRKVVVEESYNHTLWELSEPSRHLKILKSASRIETYFQIPGGRMKIIFENGRNTSEFSGAVSQQKILEELKLAEKDLANEVAMARKYTEEIFGLRKVEITYVYCKGNKETDYIELTNKRLIPVDLTGWKLTDDDEGTKPYELNVTLNPGESLRLYSNTTNITLGADDTVFLIDAHGNTISQRSCDE